MILDSDENKGFIGFVFFLGIQRDPISDIIGYAENPSDNSE